jgi:hypothetical protein
MLIEFVGNKRWKHTYINNKNGEISAKLLAGTENDKHDNHEIIKTENTQENAEKQHSHEEMRYTFRDGQTGIYF